MRTTLRCLLIVILMLGSAARFARAQSAASDPLPSWNDGPTKSAILGFVHRVTQANSPDFVPIDERIAVFDNDGTLWGEQPMYVQLAFALDRVKALAPQHPEWTNKEPFASILKHEFKQVAASGEKGIMELLAATHAGMTVEEFNREAKAWIITARHPKTRKLYTEMVYQPMLELIAHLRAHGFKTFVVSGGGVEFMRAWTERVYGIPPEQIVGSSMKLKFEMRDGLPTLTKLPEIDLVDDKAGKPVGIQRQVGRRPIFAAGNSDGDLQMLQYTTIARSADDKTPRFGLIVHHTDAEREYAYDRDSPFGRLDEALAEATRRGWAVVDMKTDWNRIYPSTAP
jgi:phosphoserine phosphatase